MDLRTWANVTGSIGRFTHLHCFCGFGCSAGPRVWTVGRGSGLHLQDIGHFKTGFGPHASVTSSLRFTSRFTKT